jgi:hypothetical protein
MIPCAAVDDYWHEDQGRSRGQVMFAKFRMRSFEIIVGKLEVGPVSAQRPEWRSLEHGPTDGMFC